MSETADIVIVGAGIIGMSAAFQIARRSAMRVIVLDKGLSAGEGSTGASSAVCRFRYSYPEIVQLAKDGISAYRHWPEFLGNATPNAAYNRIGVLWMAADGEWARTETQRLSSLGVRAETLDNAQVRQRFPALSTCVVAPDLVEGRDHDCRRGNAYLFEADGGYMDPMDALQDLVVATRSRGVEVRFSAGVDDITTASGVVTGVRLADGSTISAPAVVMAAGPWCVPFLARHGLNRNWPLEATRIQIAHIDRPAALAGDLPVCVDMPGGIYFRPQNRGQQLIIGSVLEEDEREFVADPDHLARHADDEFIRPKLFALQHRLGLHDIRGHIRGYSGLYTINRADMHPIVGATPVPGLYLANGCSGHGFKLAPALGGLIARELTGLGSDFDTLMPPSFLSFGREPIRLDSMSVLA